MNMDPGQITSCGSADFYVVIKEPGHTDPSLPVWACTEPGGIRYRERPAAVIERNDLSDVPGVFHLLNVLSDEECDRFVQISEALGYHGDAPVSLPRSIRHNNNFNWIVDESVDGPIWDRCRRSSEFPYSMVNIRWASMPDSGSTDIAGAISSTLTQMAHGQVVGSSMANLWLMHMAIG